MLFSLISLFRVFSLLQKSSVRSEESLSYLASVTTAELWQHLSNMEMIFNDQLLSLKCFKKRNLVN